MFRLTTWLSMNPWFARPPCPSQTPQDWEELEDTTVDQFQVPLPRLSPVANTVSEMIGKRVGASIFRCW